MSERKKGFWHRFFAVFDALHLIVAVVMGLAAAYLLGSVFGMGLKGYALGFFVGTGIVLGGLTIGLD